MPRVIDPGSAEIIFHLSKRIFMSANSSRENYFLFLSTFNFLNFFFCFHCLCPSALTSSSFCNFTRSPSSSSASSRSWYRSTLKKWKKITKMKIFEKKWREIFESKRMKKISTNAQCKYIYLISVDWKSLVETSLINYHFDNTRNTQNFILTIYLSLSLSFSLSPSPSLYLSLSLSFTLSLSPSFSLSPSLSLPPLFQSPHCLISNMLSISLFLLHSLHLTLSPTSSSLLTVH